MSEPADADEESDIAATMLRLVAERRAGFVDLPTNHAHSLWTTTEPAIVQVTGTARLGVQSIDPKNDPSKQKS